MNINDIPIHDIILFLTKNNITIKNDPYDQALILIKKGTDFYPVSIIEWTMAYNLLRSKTNIRKYSISEIVFMPELELEQLSRSLGMKTTKIKHIIKILEYAGKLDISDNLNEYPIESLLEMKILLNRMNYREIISYCSNNKNKLYSLCELPEAMNIIRKKSTEMDVDFERLKSNELDFVLNKVFPPTWDGYFK